MLQKGFYNPANQGQILDTDSHSQPLISLSELPCWNLKSIHLIENQETKSPGIKLFHQLKIWF